MKLILIIKEQKKSSVTLDIVDEKNFNKLLQGDNGEQFSRSVVGSYFHKAPTILKNMGKELKKGIGVLECWFFPYN